MNKLPILLRREFQEQRGTFLYLPLGIAAFLFVILISGLFFVNAADNNDVSYRIGQQSDSEVRAEGDGVVFRAFYGERLQELADMSPVAREDALEKVYYGLASPFFMVLWFVLFFYLIGSLYDDRRDRSILFWKSMPVSDAMTIASKLLAAALVAPAIYLLGIMAVHVGVLLISSLSAIGYSVDVWDTLWAPANIVTRWLWMAGLLLLNAIWLLPSYGWILLVSSWAKSAPLIWVFAIPLVIVVLEQTFTSSDVISTWIVRHSLPVGFDGHASVDLESVIDRFMSVEFVISLLVGAALV